MEEESALQKWWRCWLWGWASTSSGAAFALQVSIAVWSDAAGICRRNNCLVCAKFFHTALFQHENCDPAAAIKTQSSQQTSTLLANTILWCSLYSATYFVIKFVIIFLLYPFVPSTVPL